MLDRAMIDRIDRLVDTGIKGRDEELKKEISRIKEEMSFHGNLFSSATIMRIIETYQQELKVRAGIVHHCILRVHQIYGHPVTDSISDDLKKIFSEKMDFIFEVLKDASGNEIPKFGNNKPYIRILDDTREDIIHKYDVEFDLYFDKIRIMMQNQKGTNGSVINIGNIAMFQYGDYTNATVTVNIQPQDKDNLIGVLKQMQKYIEEKCDKNQNIEEIRQLVQESIIEICKPSPNHIKMRSFLLAIIQIVNTTAALYTLYQPLKTALLPYGFDLP